MIFAIGFGLFILGYIVCVGLGTGSNPFMTNKWDQVAGALYLAGIVAMFVSLGTLAIRYLP
jgi:uncharacterized protein (DUF486 family)